MLLYNVHYTVWQSLDHPKYLPGSGILLVIVTVRRWFHILHFQITLMTKKKEYLLQTDRIPF